MEKEINLRIILEKPTADTDFGIQQGSGHTYVTLQKQKSTGEDLAFEVTVRVKPSVDGSPVFLGAVTQGPPKERFVYIDIGRAAGQLDTLWSRRLKIPLKSITWEQIQQLDTAQQAVLEVRIPGVGKDGGPNCGGAKLTEGWKMRVHS